MTPLAKAVSNLPEQQLILMVRILITQQIAELISSEISVKNKKEEINKIQHLEVVKVLPEDEQKSIFEMCKNAVEVIEIMD